MTNIVLDSKSRKLSVVKVRQAFNNAYDYFKYYVFPQYIHDYEAYCLDSSRRALYLASIGDSDRSNIRFPLIPTVQDTFHANSYDSYSKIIAVPQEEEDFAKKEAVQASANWGLLNQENRQIIKKVDREGLLCGVSYSKVGFEFYTDKSQQFKSGKKINITKEVARPVLSHVDIFGMIFNPHATDWNFTPKWYREITTKESIKGQYAYFLKKLTDKDWDNIMNKPKPFSHDDFSKAKNLKYFKDQIIKDKTDNLKRQTSNIAHITNATPVISYTDTRIFEVDYEKTGLLEKIEYFEGNTYMLIVNGWEVFQGPTPYSFEGDPFVRHVFGDEPGNFPQGIGAKLQSLQQSCDAFLNNWIDGVGDLINSPIIMDQGIFGDKTPEVVKISRRKVYARQPGKGFDRMEIVNPIALQTLQSGIEYFVQKAYERMSLNTYSVGGEGKVERGTGAAQIKANLVKQSLQAFQENKNLALSIMANKTISLMRDYMPEKFNVRIMGTGGEVEFKKITKDDLLNNFDFHFDNNSEKTMFAEMRRANLISAIQSMEDPLTRKVLEEELLHTFDLKVPTMEDKKKTIDEEFEIEQYKQQKAQQLTPPANPNTPANIPGVNPQNIPLEQPVPERQRIQIPTV